jgi:DNA-binding transcriptional regulator YdaS (Cro superfamily)
MSDPIIAIIRDTKGLTVLLAKRFGISGSAIRQWERVPPKRALPVARFLKLHPHVVRPDIYPPPRRPRRLSETSVKQEVQ